MNIVSVMCVIYAGRTALFVVFQVSDQQGAVLYLLSELTGLVDCVMMMPCCSRE